MTRFVSWTGLLLAAATPAVVLSSLGCKEPSSPGGAVGTFQVLGELTESSCGAGFTPPPSLRFRAELRRDGDVAYWRMNDERARVPGTIDARGRFRFRVDAVVEGWPADPVNGIPACRFTQSETIDGTLEVDDADAGQSPDAGALRGADAGAARALSFTGTNTITIGVAPGFDCTLALESAGGGGRFAALPCGARYAIDGATTP